MSGAMTYYLNVDMTDAETKYARLRQMVDDWVADFETTRQQVMRDLRDMNAVVGYTIQSVRLIARATGNSVDVLLNAVLQGIQLAASSLLAISAAYYATGVLSLVGAIIMGASLGLSIGQYAVTLRDSEAIKRRISEIERSLSAVSTTFSVSPFGGL